MSGEVVEFLFIWVFLLNGRELHVEGNEYHCCKPLSSLLPSRLSNKMVDIKLFFSSGWLRYVEFSATIHNLILLCFHSNDMILDGLSLSVCHSLWCDDYLKYRV